jgi:hypothetical protein
MHSIANANSRPYDMSKYGGFISAFKNKYDCE